jgi:hypothetical protein
MRGDVRLVFITTVPVAAFLVYDGIHGLLRGHFLGQRHGLKSAVTAEGPTFQIGDTNQYVEYGLWALPFEQLGADPHQMAPYFVALGLIGLLGMVGFWRARPWGWVATVAFATMGLFHLGFSTLLCLAALVVLFLPSTRRRLLRPDPISHPLSEPASVEKPQRMASE